MIYDFNYIFAITSRLTQSRSTSKTPIYWSNNSFQKSSELDGNTNETVSVLINFNLSGCRRGVMVKAMNCAIELQSCSYVQF